MSFASFSFSQTAWVTQVDDIRRELAELCRLMGASEFDTMTLSQSDVQSPQQIISSGLNFIQNKVRWLRGRIEKTNDDAMAIDHQPKFEIVSSANMFKPRPEAFEKARVDESTDRTKYYPSPFYQSFPQKQEPFFGESNGFK